MADRSYVFAGGNDMTIMQWNVSSGERIEEYAGHTANILTLQLRANLLFSGAPDRTVRIYDIEGNENRIFIQCRLT